MHGQRNRKSSIYAQRAYKYAILAFLENSQRKEEVATTTELK
jgi:hypothetical protein